MERNKMGLLLCKAESTYGTDPVPTESANNIGVVRDSVSFSPEGDTFQRAILDPGYGRVIGMLTMQRVSLAFRTEVRGNRTGAASNDVAKGSASYPVEIDPLLKACDLTPTLVAETSGGARDGFTFYRPAIPSTEFGASCTSYFYTEQKLYKMTGLKGDFSIQFNAGKISYIDWVFQGFYNVPTDNTPIPSGTFLTTLPPKLEKPGNVLNAVAVTASSSSGLLITYAAHGLFNGDRVKFAAVSMPGNLTAGTYYYLRDVTANTFKLAATLNGTAIAYSSAGTTVTMTSLRSLLFGAHLTPVFQTLNFKLGNSVQMRPDGNSSNGIRGWVIADRQSTIDVDVESEVEATDPRHTDWVTPVLRNIRLNQGATSGNRFALDCTGQLSRLSYGERNGVRTQPLVHDIVQANVGDAPGSELALIFQ